MLNRVAGIFALHLSVICAGWWLVAWPCLILFYLAISVLC